MNLGRPFPLRQSPRTLYVRRLFHCNAAARRQSSGRVISQSTVDATVRLHDFTDRCPRPFIITTSVRSFATLCDIQVIHSESSSRVRSSPASAFAHDDLFNFQDRNARHLRKSCRPHCICTSRSASRLRLLLIRFTPTRIALLRAHSPQLRTPRRCHSANESARARPAFASLSPFKHFCATSSRRFAPRWIRPSRSATRFPTVNVSVSCRYAITSTQAHSLALAYIHTRASAWCLPPKPKPSAAYGPRLVA